MSMAALHDETTMKRAAPAPRRRRFPRLPLYGALGFVGFSVAAIVFANSTGIGTVLTERGAPAAVRDVVIEQMPAEVLHVRDASSGTLIASFDDGEGGFVRGSMRAFNRMRFVGDVPASTPYRIIRWSDGSVSLSDTGTGERFYLDAFGKDNAAAFAAFLEGHGDRGE